MKRVGIIGDNSIEYIKKLIEIWNNSDCAVLIDWRIPHNAAIEMMRDASVSKCYIDRRLSNRINNISSDIDFILFNGSNTPISIVPEYIYDIYKHSYNVDEAVIIYSSGTTGKAKGIILSHKAINLNADLIAEYMSLSANDCLYIVKTLAHSSTLIGELLVGLKKGIKIVISPTINNPRNILEMINEYRVTTICVNPTLLSLYSFIVNSKKMIFNSLKTIYTSGAIVEKGLIEEARKIFTNTDILNVYGLTEAGPRVSAQRKGDSANSIGSVGKPLNMTDVVIISTDGFQVKKMEKGIIHVNTPCLFSGYILNKLQRVSLYNNWLNTGDIGYIDKNNNLFITGRVDNMITVGSHNVYPEEIEAVLMKNPSISDCIIVSQKNNIQGNIIMCFYVSEEDVSYDLRKYCIINFASYEIPSVYIKIEKIFTTENGKKVRDISKYISYLSK